MVNFNISPTNPLLSDTILFDLYTTDVNGNLVNPYLVDTVIIYFIQRDYISSNLEENTTIIGDFSNTSYYSSANPIQIYGTDDFPAWISSDTADAFLTKIDFIPNGNPDIGHFQLQWTPEENTQAREGDYFICYTWTPIPAGDSYSQLIQFYVGGSVSTPIIPSHRTNPLKYPTMLERYTPEMFKQYLSVSDITPQVIHKTNLAVASAFTDLENLANQIVDLLDANVVQEVFLPYLANMFRWTLRSDDPMLWRRQVKQAIPLYKRKGTLGGLKEALAESGIEFRKLTIYWQVVSKSTWQEGFIVQPNQTIFCLSKVALLPADTNYHVYHRVVGSTTYTEISLDYVNFATTTDANTNCINNQVYTTCVTVNVALQSGDVIRIIYKVAPVLDQSIENYIQTLDLEDQRDETTITYPVKNWNVRLIAEDDYLFPLVCPVKNPFAYPIVWGKIRTEFPYSENIYNMDVYNGGIRDSNDPCDLDYTFVDVCSCCRSSCISIDVGIQELSSDRVTEAEDIITEFIPFHAIVHSINYVGIQEDLILPPLEELECLIQYNLEDTIALTQFDFDRIILNADDYTNIIKRDMLADANAVATGNDGIGTNIAYSIFSPGVDFGEIGINNENNLLEILSGTNEGDYKLLTNGSKTTADVVGLSQFPLDCSGFPFRFSNIQYEETGVSVYQDNLTVFSDVNVDFSLFPIPDGNIWVINVISGEYTGIYPILSVNPDNTLVLLNWVGGTSIGFSYQLNAPGNINVMNGSSGQVIINYRGRVETQLIQYEYPVAKGDYVLFGGVQYPLWFFGVRVTNATIDKVYIDGYMGGDQVGAVNIQILRRLLDVMVGYINFRGMQLTTTMNYEVSLGIQDGVNAIPVSDFLDNSDFKQNYLILIGTTYYQMVNIDGNVITLSGPVCSWGLAGTTGISYTIIQFVKHPVTIQSGYDSEFRTFEPFVDRQGGGSDFVEIQNESMPMAFRMQMLNKLNDGEIIEDFVKAKESLSYTVVYKE